MEAIEHSIQTSWKAARTNPVSLYMHPDGRIHVLCADDHPLVRNGIGWVWAVESDMLLVAEAGAGREALELFRVHKPDVALIDLRVAELDGVAATEAILGELP